MSQLLTIDWGAVFRRLAAVVSDPASNPIVAGFLIGLVSLVVVILLVIALMYVVGRSDLDEESPEADEEEHENMYPILPEQSSENGQADGDEVRSDEGAVAPATRRRPRMTLVGVAIVAAVGLGVWVATGVLTSQSTLCIACHAGSVHSKAPRTDPHTAVTCVACHEPGGALGSVTYMVAPRGVHFVSGILSTKVTDGYSVTVSSGACLRCHASVIGGTVTIPAQGVRMSHKEPLAAGAQCVDCHSLTGGIVSNRTVGMTPCLRCHDGHTASSACSTCHTTDIGVAVRPSADTTLGPHVLIETPNCYSCHEPKACDDCHGIRMPHTKDFILHGHARAAATDFWHGSGKTCSKCHTATRNPCSKCHQGSMPSHGAGLGWALGHQYGSPTNCSIGCHGYQTGGGTRQMCEFCHDKPMTARKASGAPVTTP